MEKIVDMQEHAQGQAEELSEPREGVSNASGDQETGIRSQIELERKNSMLEEKCSRLEAERGQALNERNEGIDQVSQLQQKLMQAKENELTAWRELHNLRVNYAAVIEQLQQAQNHVH